MDKEKKEDTSAPASEEKSSEILADVAIDDSIGYVILNFISVFSALSDFVRCKRCGKSVKFHRSNIQGLGFYIDVSCESCPVVKIPCCPVKKDLYDVNRRIVLAMRLLGIGLAGIRKFCGIMDLPQPLCQLAYDAFVKRLEVVSKALCKTVMRQSVEIEKQLMKEAYKTAEIEGLTVSSDETSRVYYRGTDAWYYKVVSIIGYFSNNILDYTIELEHGKDSQTCSTNVDQHKNLPVIKMITRSVSKYGLKYTRYVGDLIKQTDINDSVPYGPSVKIEEKQCIESLEETVESELKHKGGLPDELCYKFSSRYCTAIRKKSDSVESMKYSIWATFFHATSTDEDPNHHLCPEGLESPCMYQRAIAQQTLKHYRHKGPLDKHEIKKIEKVYEAFSTNRLLEKCIGMFMRSKIYPIENPGEHNLWKIASEDVFWECKNIEFATCIDVCMINNGISACMNIMEALNIAVGINCVNYCQNELKIEKLLPASSKGN